jgi:hypothetical protein
VYFLVVLPLSRKQCASEYRFAGYSFKRPGTVDDPDNDAMNRRRQPFRDSLSSSYASSCALFSVAAQWSGPSGGGWWTSRCGGGGGRFCCLRHERVGRRGSILVGPLIPLFALPPDHDGHAVFQQRLLPPLSSSYSSLAPNTDRLVVVFGEG